MNLKSLAARVIWRVLQWRLFSTIRPRLVHTNCFLLKGKTKENLDLSLLVFSNYENIAYYLSNFAFSTEPQTTFLGRTTCNKLSSIISKNKPDLVIGQFAGIFSRFLSKSFLVLPAVNFSLGISRPTQEIVADMMTLRRRSIRKVEDSSYVYEVTRDLEKFESFYRNIYLPFAAKTARESFSRLIPFATVKKWFLSGELLLVKSNNEYLAGLLYHPEPSGVIHCRLIAYTEGLAAQAALYRLIQKAKQDGYTRIDYGVAPPLMSDGLFFYKKSLGMEIDPVMDAVLAVAICNFEKPVQNFLISNPLVFTDFKDMIGLVTLPRSSDVNLSSLCHKYYARGLHKILFLYPEEYTEKFQALSSKAVSEIKLGALDSMVQLARTMNYEIGIFGFQTSHCEA